MSAPDITTTIKTRNRKNVSAIESIQENKTQRKGKKRG